MVRVPDTASEMEGLVIVMICNWSDWMVAQKSGDILQQWLQHSTSVTFLSAQVVNH